MANPNMYVTVKRVNPERLQCPVKDCQAEGKEENRVETPCIEGLGALTVYLCDAHATSLAVMFLDKNMAIDGIQWDEPEKDGGVPARPGEAGALYAFMGWLTTREQVSGPFSRSHDTSGSGSLVKQFIDMQGWPDPPDGWHHCIKPFEEEEKEALGRAHMEYHKLARARIENYNQRVPDPVTKITWTGAMPLGTTSDTGYELEDISYGHAPIEEV